MRRHRLARRIYVYVLASALAALLTTGLLARRTIRLFHESRVSSELLVRARLLARHLPPDPERDRASADRFCKEAGQTSATRVTVILPDGTVAGDSDMDTSQMDNHRDRPEVAAALAAREGTSVRFSDTLRRRLMYVAVPVQRDGRVAAALRTALPLMAVEAEMRAVGLHLAAAAAIVAALLAGAALLLVRRIALPLSDMEEAARRLAAGDLTARAAVPADRELAALAHTLNHMAVQLGERIETVTCQHNEQSAVLASMAEGVIAVDADGRVINRNAAACRLLDIPPDTERGKTVYELVRNPDLHEFLARTAEASETTEGEIAMHGTQERHLQLHGTPLTDTSGRRIGSLVVLTDVTRLKMLETVRRDFVANASHELKTPITAIKACAETLAGAEPGDAADARRFLAMLNRHADRLVALVEDLLDLSRIEHDTEGNAVVMQPGAIRPAIEKAIADHTAAATAKNIAIRLDCRPDLTTPFNAPLLEQAAGNLLDNAVKYSPADTTVEVAAEACGDWVEIRVSDQGPGIEKKHLARIFERFYRVDTARSRALGGTGLGLSIVRHIALAHGGSVSVASTPGQGSTFTIRIPRR